MAAEFPVPKLFEGYPVLQDDVLLLSRLTLDDADSLCSLAGNPEVYRYLPTFLYEQRYDDIHTVLQNMHKECFETKESLFLGVRLKGNLPAVMGIAEVYNYQETDRHASIGYRFNEQYWGHGYATRTACLLRDYLTDTSGVDTITAHVMKENGASARVLEKAGFTLSEANLWEDWGFGHPVMADKYIFCAQR